MANRRRRNQRVIMHGDNLPSVLVENAPDVEKKEDGEIINERKNEPHKKSANRKSRSRSPKSHHVDKKHRSSRSPPRDHKKHDEHRKSRSRSRDRKKRDDHRKDGSPKRKSEPRRESRGFRREDTRERPRNHQRSQRDEGRKDKNNMELVMKRLKDLETDLNHHAQVSANVERLADDMKEREKAILNELESNKRAQRLINLNNEENNETMEQYLKFDSLIHRNGIDSNVAHKGMYPCIFVSGELMASKFTLGMASFTALMKLFGCNTVHVLCEENARVADVNIIRRSIDYFNEKQTTGPKPDKSLKVDLIQVDQARDQEALLCRCCRKPMTELGITHRHVAQLRRNVVNANRIGAASGQAEVVGEKEEKLEPRSVVPFLYVCLEEFDPKYVKIEEDLATIPGSFDDFPCITFFVDPYHPSSIPTVCVRGRHNEYLSRERQVLNLYLTKESVRLQLTHAADTKRHKRIAPARSDRKTEAKAKDPQAAPGNPPGNPPGPANLKPKQDPINNDPDRERNKNDPDYDPNMYENVEIPSLSV